MEFFDKVKTITFVVNGKEATFDTEKMKKALINKHIEVITVNKDNVEVKTTDNAFEDMEDDQEDMKEEEPRKYIYEVYSDKLKHSYGFFFDMEKAKDKIIEEYISHCNIVLTSLSTIYLCNISRNERYDTTTRRHFNKYIDFKDKIDEAMSSDDKDHKIYLFRKALTNIKEYFDIGICFKSHLM